MGTSETKLFQSFQTFPATSWRLPSTAGIGALVFRANETEGETEIDTAEVTSALRRSIVSGARAHLRSQDSTPLATKGRPRPSRSKAGLELHSTSGTRQSKSRHSIGRESRGLGFGLVWVGLEHASDMGVGICCCPCVFAGMWKRNKSQLVTGQRFPVPGGVEIREASERVCG